MREYIVSVMSRDRPGIVASVSSAIASVGGNITHLSETVLRGYFTIILSLEAPDDLLCAALRAALVNAGGHGEYEVGVLPYEPSADTLQDSSTDRFVLTARCRDQKGIIARISGVLAGLQINIDDFYAYVLGDELIMILEIGVRFGTQLDNVKSELEKLASETGIAAHLQHQDIFRATTELQAVLRLGDKR